MRALILDDEFTAADYLEVLIKRHCAQIKTTHATTSIDDSIKLIKSGEVDILFTDIEMDQMTGLELVLSFEKDEMPPVIFTTAYNQYAIEALRANAIDYLLKPIDPEELKNAVDSISKRNKEGQNNLEQLFRQLGTSSIQRLTIPEGQEYHIIQVSDIIRAEGSGNYTTFYLVGGRKIVASRGLKHYETLLPEEPEFIRPHQSHLINVSHIVQYSKADGGSLLLKEGHNVPVSGRMKENVQKALGLS